MNANKINQYVKGHENAMLAMLDIIGKHSKTVSSEMIKEMEEFHEGIIYTAEAMRDEQ